MKPLKTWRLFWIFSLILTTIFVLVLNTLVILPTNYYLLPSFLFVAGQYISLGLAHKYASYDHYVTKNPISFLGQINAKGKSNIKAAILFIGFSISYGGIVFLLANIIFRSYPHNLYLAIIVYALLGVVVAVIMMTLIPIDISRELHLIATALWLGLYLAANIALVYFFFNIHQVYVNIPLFYFIACFSHIISACIYLISYFAHYHASLFQKIWIFFSNFCLLTTINLFTKLL